MKEFFEEFKKFINRGNAIELAVGVVVGGAFTSIVNSLVNDIISPVIGRIVGGVDFRNVKIPLGGEGESYIMIGSFIQTIIDFIIVAFVLFVVIRSINKAAEVRKQKRKQEEIQAAKEDSEEIKLLKSINSELKKLNKKSSK